MKTIKSALLGTKSLIDTNDKVILLQLAAIFKEHRGVIITRLIRDIPTYVDYKFHVIPDREQITSIKDSLLDLKNAEVDLNYYKPIIMYVLSHEITYLMNEPFYSEIDEYLLLKVNEMKGRKLLNSEKV